MALDFIILASAGKHGISRADAEYAVRAHREVVALSSRRPHERSFMFLGHPHGQTDRWIEVGVPITLQGHREIFHAMPIIDVENWPRPEMIGER